MFKALAKIYTELGLRALVSSKRDTKNLCLQRLIRLAAYGSTTLVLTLFFTSLGHSNTQAGLFMTLTLLGDVVLSFFLTMVADKIGRRYTLAFGALLMTASGVVFALFSNYWILLIASVLGVISPSGWEVGPFRAIGESVISHLVPSTDRGSVLAWYSLFGNVGAALGTISLGWLVQALQQDYHWDPLDSYRVVFWVYAALGFLKFILCLCLSPECELKRTAKAIENASPEQQPLLGDISPSHKARFSAIAAVLPHLSRHTLSLMFRLCLLFVLDNFGTGVASQTWLVYYFNQKFGIEEGRLGSLFFFTNLLSAVSNLAAASIARRIGLVKTMVFTHLPASIMLIVLPLPRNQIVAMALLLVRSSITSMDVVPRQAFLAAAVLPEERTAVMGIVNVVKTVSQAGGPVMTGALAGIGKFGYAFIIAGAMKTAYDLLMLAMFAGYRTIEERAEGRIGTEQVTDEASSTVQR